MVARLDDVSAVALSHGEELRHVAVILPMRPDARRSALAFCPPRGTLPWVAEKKKARGAKGAKGESPEGHRPVARNRRARFRYNVLERFEAGIELKGNEVKSIRDSGCGLEDAYARFQGPELYLVGAKISPYDKGRPEEQSTERPRRLLMHRRELERIAGKLLGSGLTLVPLSVYFQRGWAKVRLGLAQGKGGRDRREDIKRRDHEREMARARKRRR